MKTEQQPSEESQILDIINRLRSERADAKQQAREVVITEQQDQDSEVDGEEPKKVRKENLRGLRDVSAY